MKSNALKLSQTTVKVLKNFSQINQGIVVHKGNVLRTFSPNRSTLAEAVIEEKFPRGFGIYDLNKTLSLLSFTNENEIVVEEDFLEFKGLNGVGKIRQRYTETSLINSPDPNKKININDFVVEVDLTVEVLEWIFNVANVLKCPNIVIRGDSDSIEVVANDVKGVIVDDANVSLSGTADMKFSVAIKVENLMIIPQPYKVQISPSGVCKFTNEDESLTYWIAIEKNHSEFGD